MIKNPDFVLTEDHSTTICAIPAPFPKHHHRSIVHLIRKLLLMSILHHLKDDFAQASNLNLGQSTVGLFVIFFLMNISGKV